MAGLLVDDQLVDGIQPTLDEFFLREVWSRPGFELAADAWVVTDGAGAIVAYGQARLGPRRRRVVGRRPARHGARHRRLLGRIEARAAELLAGVDSPRFRHSISAR